MLAKVRVPKAGYHKIFGNEMKWMGKEIVHRYDTIGRIIDVKLEWEGDDYYYEVTVDLLEFEVS